MAVVACFSLATARAQVFFAGAQLAVDWTVNDEDKVKPSFTLPSQSNDIKDSMEEFTRLVEHEQWEKAFKSLETITAKTSSGFIDRGDGVLVPSRLLVRGLLAGLPSAGKTAYRLFYDAQAQALLDKATGKAEAEYLAMIVNNHLISSVGDYAADRLGDLYFEQGEFEQAIGAWRSILTYCPDAKLSKAQLYVKIATALARSGRWNELQDIQALVADRYAAETVELGGRRTSAADEVKRLAATADDADAKVVAARCADDFELPAQAEPLWQFKFQSKVDPNDPTQPFPLTDMYGRRRANDFLIPSAADDERVYVNVFGIEMAFDVETGKLLWRSGKLHELQLQQQRQGIMPERYSIMVSQGRTWSVLRDPRQANQGIGFSLMVRDAATGKEVFNTRRWLSAWNVLSSPCLVAAAGDRVDSAPTQTALEPAAATPVVDYPNGFAGAADKFKFNGTAKLDGNQFQLTDGGGNQAASVFAATPVSVAAFRTRFTLRMPAAPLSADGFTFTIQGQGPTALRRQRQRTGLRRHRQKRGGEVRPAGAELQERRKYDRPVSQWRTAHTRRCDQADRHGRRSAQRPRHAGRNGLRRGDPARHDHRYRHQGQQQAKLRSQHSGNGRRQHGLRRVYGCHRSTPLQAERRQLDVRAAKGAQDELSEPAGRIGAGGELSQRLCRGGRALQIQRRVGSPRRRRAETDRR